MTPSKGHVPVSDCQQPSLSQKLSTTSILIQLHFCPNCCLRWLTHWHSPPLKCSSILLSYYQAQSTVRLWCSQSKNVAFLVLSNSWAILIETLNLYIAMTKTRMQRVAVAYGWSTVSKFCAKGKDFILIKLSTAQVQGLNNKLHVIIKLMFTVLHRVIKREDREAI